MKEINHVGIVGSGTMGSKIAYRCAISGLETFLYDNDPEALERARQRIEDWIAQRRSDLSLWFADEARTAIQVRG